MQWAKAAVAQPGDAEGEIWPGELSRENHPDQHADHTPKDCCEGKETHDVVLVTIRDTGGAARI